MISQDDVVDLYQAMLGRRPESAARIEKVIAKHPSRNSLALDLRGSEEFRKRAEPLLRHAFKQTDGYQAAYRLPALSGQNARPCEDRCAAIDKHLRGPLRCRHMGHLRILDIGCAQGYSSLYFAERGATVFGIDSVAQNIEFCKLLATTLQLNATFRQQLFSEATVQFAIDTGVNVLFFLSVLHHIIAANGLDWTRAALRRLLDNKITIIAELAKKDEIVPFEWKDHLPADELEVFGNQNCRAVEIEKFSALNGKVVRPLYCVQQSQLSYRGVSGAACRPEQKGKLETLTHGMITFSEVSNAPVPEKQYAISDDKFSKIFRLGAPRDRRLLARALSSELTIGSQLASMGIAPQVMGTFSAEGCFGVIYARVKGDDLVAFIKRSDMASRRRCAVNIAKKYALMRKVGIYWNDCRLHNILIDVEEIPFFVDFELASFIELEDNRRRFLWMMWHLCHSEHGGLIPEATLPTSELPVIADDPADGCREWLKLIEITSFPNEGDAPLSVAASGFDAAGGSPSSTSGQIDLSRGRKAPAELETLPTSQLPAIGGNRANASAEPAEALKIFEHRHNSLPSAGGNDDSPEERWVRALYRVLLGREPDPAGFAGHVRELKAGRQLEDLMRGFLQSREFATRYSKFAQAHSHRLDHVSLERAARDVPDDRAG